MPGSEANRQLERTITPFIIHFDLGTANRLIGCIKDLRIGHLAGDGGLVGMTIKCIDLEPDQFTCGIKTFIGMHIDLLLQKRCIIPVDLFFYRL